MQESLQPSSSLYGLLLKYIQFSWINMRNMNWTVGESQLAIPSWSVELFAVLATLNSWRTAHMSSSIETVIWIFIRHVKIHEYSWGWLFLPGSDVICVCQRRWRGAVVWCQWDLDHHETGRCPASCPKIGTVSHVVVSLGNHGNNVKSCWFWWHPVLTL